MTKSEKIIEKLLIAATIHPEEIPEIDLYMDQVIQLFDSKYGQSLRNEDEKVLTKTMINNYAKGKLFNPVKNKKYSKQHIMMISLIYQLKGALSISDIKETLDPINKKMEQDDFRLTDYYSSWVEIQQKNARNFLKELSAHESEIELAEVDEDLKKILFIASLANMSNAYRKAAELLVDELIEKKGEEKK